MNSSLRLFKVVLIPNHRDDVNYECDSATQKATIRAGFVLAPDVMAHYTGDARARLLAEIEQLYGRDGAKLNQAFHKSWGKVKNASIEQLVLEQLIHYITTYGFEQLGFFSHDTVYIPGEHLDAPEFKDGLRLVVIRGLTAVELREELLQLLSSGIALSETTMTDVLDLVPLTGITKDDLERVRNKEARAALYTYLGVTPNDPVEFLRYVVYKTTGSTMLIKNRATCTAIAQNASSLDIARAFEIYSKDPGLNRLGEIFNRYKPLFLAFRQTPQLRATVNEIRRRARSEHKPLIQDALNTATATIARGKRPNLAQALENANTFRKVRLAYALKFRTRADADSIVYRVRNGKTWVTSFKFDESAQAAASYLEVMASIISDVHANVAGKSIYIPDGVHYALPSTERQFAGNVPAGTYVEAGKNLVVGVHWTNVGQYRVDLDLSMVSAGLKLGWDGGYRSHDSAVLFSGDMTDAPEPNGASEFYYIDKASENGYLLILNHYNRFYGEVSVPFQVIAGKQKSADKERDFVADPNRILATSHSSMDESQKVLGIVTAVGGSQRFYFAEFKYGRGMSARSDARSEQTRRYLFNYYLNAISLNDVLRGACARFVDTAAEAEIDLTPESIDKNTIIRLLSQAR
jgi:hypothetical protein